MSIKVIEVNRKSGFVVIRAGNIYLEFQRFPGGKIIRTNRWKYSQDDTGFYVPQEFYSKAKKTAAAILNKKKKRLDLEKVKQFKLF